MQWHDGLTMTWRNTKDPGAFTLRFISLQSAYTGARSMVSLEECLWSV